jgi:hypothetical protein
MDELYLKVGNKKEPIDQSTAEKYHLESGTLSPFTRKPIVGKDGSYHKNTNPGEDSESSIREDFNNMPFQGEKGDGIDGMDNGFELSQSEIIDFSQGVDSRMDENR